MSKLLIVESPAKAKTITKYLGQGYKVKASMGHLRDLPKKKLGVDVDNNFEAEYIPIDGKEKMIKELKSEADSAEIVYLATDPDREGEAISWHLRELLNLPVEKTRRITFNEITKKAVTDAVNAPRELDMQLVDAQQARRILDRIVGYKLSPFLWRKVRTGLSAGRVQSVVTRIIVDREREIQAFIAEEYWSIDVTLETDQKSYITHFYGNTKGKLELHNEDETNKVLAAIDGALYTIKSVKKAQKKKQPAPPFITSTLQQEASRKLGMTARRTMSVAQELYEGVEIGSMGLTGLITYMRTDSLRLSDEALDGARAYIGSRFGANYMPSKPRVFKSKKSAQDAHEAVRPSLPDLDPDSIRGSLTPDQYKLYRLIWSRFMASQMSEAIMDTTSADIEANDYIFRATGQTIAFSGFLALYEEGRDDAGEDDDGSTLPKLVEGDKPKHMLTDPKQHFTQPPARYTEASLIKAMEEKGIGRPSTYAPTISVVIDREYVVKDGKALRPTALGEAVTDLMIDKFSDIVDAKFTANMEDKLDGVESGKVDYRKMLGEFYSGFDAELKQAEIDLDKQRIKVRDEVSDVACDLCGKMMVIKSGRFGKFLACPGYPDCKNTKPLSEDAGVPCPVCGAKLLKKKSKSGYYYFGCEKNPTCPFMTWDKPTNRKCPQCDGTIFKHYTKEEKKNMCHVPGCGYEEPIVSKRAAKAADGDEKPVKKPAAKKTTTKKPAVKKPAVKKPAVKKPAVKKPAVKKPAVKKPAVKEPAVKKPAVKKPAAKKSAAKKPAAKKVKDTSEDS